MRPPYPSPVKRPEGWIIKLCYMTNEQLQNILNAVVKQEYPEIDVEILVMTERHVVYLDSAKKLVYNIIFMVPPSDYGKYFSEGIDKHKWDKIRGLIRDIIKMSGIFDKVVFHYRECIG